MNFEENAWRLAFRDQQKEIKSLNQLLAMKDAGMKALEEEVERLKNQLTPLKVMLNSEMKDVRVLKSQRSYLIGRINDALEDDQVTQGASEEEWIAYLENKELEGGEDE